MRWLGHLSRFLLLLAARAVLIAAFAGALTAAWGYYGYQRIACHPMFANSASTECGVVQATAAEHSLAMVRALAPYQQTLSDNQTELAFYAGAAVIWAIMIELAFGVTGIIQRRRFKRGLPNNQTH